MDAVEFLKEKKRMCDFFWCNGGYRSCAKCGLYSRNNYTKQGCDIFVYEHPQNAVEVVKKWSEEHPRKTLLQDFLEKYPNAKIDPDGTPDFCPSALGYYGIDECVGEFCVNYCKECWGRYIDEVEPIGGDE